MSAIEKRVFVSARFPLLCWRHKISDQQKKSAPDSGHGRTRKLRGRGWFRGRVAEGVCQKRIRINP